MIQIKQGRILGIALTSRGFGYAIIDGDQGLIDYGNKVMNSRKNMRVLKHLKKMIARNKPDILVLENVNAKGTTRWPRIKKLNEKVLNLAKSHKLKTGKIPVREVRRILLGNETATKHQVASFLATLYPDELAARLPPKRIGTSEYAKMDIFDAVALARAFLTL